MRRISAFVLGIGFVGAALSAVQTAPPKPVFPSYPAPEGSIYTPATGCASASCHGGQVVGHKGSEETTWATSDPHTTAYSVLLNADSKRIAGNLKLGKAHEAKVCLACHAVDAEKVYHGELLEGRGRTEGVGCDGCHGPSGKWLSLHYTPAWKATSDRDKYERYGFTQTKDFVARSMNCAGCHVGEPGREVNHDLIAAGHPRLAFEYSRYHYSPRYTKHWVEPLANPAFEMRAWYVGQVSTLRAAVSLLEARASRADAKPADHPWPELSESSCYSCHRGLAKSPRAGEVVAPRLAGTLPWQTWYSGLADLLPKVHAAMVPGSAVPSLTEFGKLKAVMGKQVINPKDAARAAASAGAELDAWLAALQEAQGSNRFASPEPVVLANLLARAALDESGDKPRDPDWDFLGQHYLGIAAAFHASGGSAGAPAAWKAPLERLRTALKFPEPSARTRFDSPVDFDPMAVVTGFQAFRTTTSGGGR